MTTFTILFVLIGLAALLTATVWAARAWGLGYAALTVVAGVAVFALLYHFGLIGITAYCGAALGVVFKARQELQRTQLRQLAANA